MVILNKSYVMHLNNDFVNSVDATTESGRLQSFKEAVNQTNQSFKEAVQSSSE